jgi:glycine/serine hydroxymethyltransferase
MEGIIELIDDVIKNTEDENLLRAIGKKVNRMMDDFPLYR